MLLSVSRPTSAFAVPSRAGASPSVQNLAYLGQTPLNVPPLVPPG